MTKQEKLTPICNGSTGEIITELDETHEILLKKDINKIKLKCQSKRFLKISQASITLMGQIHFTPGEVLVLNVALDYLSWDTGEIIEGKTTINKKRLLELVRDRENIADGTFDNALNNLIKKDIIARKNIKGNNVYYINPFIYQKGEYTNMETYILFKDSQWNTLGERYIVN